jgi:hypothetical protein
MQRGHEIALRYPSTTRARRGMVDGELRVATRERMLPTAYCPRVVREED